MISLADWRRRVAEVYARVRANPDPRTAWRDWRAVRDALFAEHPQSPLPPAQRAGFHALPFFDYDPELRLLVEIDEPGGRAARRLDIGADGTVVLEPAARTRGLADTLGGELTVYWTSGYGGGVFLPFTDATSGAETFGGGRYLLDGLKGADLGQAEGRLVLDFNFAYNPSCAHSAAWTCPLAPAENRLPGAVRAGEQAAAAGAAQRLRA
jgi:uncharacterized protein (DUF1684 family)